MERYQYQPIKSLDSIRMLQLFPGEPSDPIQVKLCHRPLSDLPKCEALSYEWGSSTRDVDILCEGKILKVTPNLLAALHRLRYAETKPDARHPSSITPNFVAAFQRLHFTRSDSSARRPRLLWIDAVCINQDDPAERSQQVRLMADIYRTAGRVLVWTGEELPLTPQAMDIMPQLAEIFKFLHYDENSHPEFPKERQDIMRTVQLSDGTRLDQLPRSASWPPLLNILASRTVFR